MPVARGCRIGVRNAEARPLIRRPVFLAIPQAASSQTRRARAGLVDSMRIIGVPRIVTACQTPVAQPVPNRANLTENHQGSMS